MIEAPLYCAGCEKPLTPYICKASTPTATLSCNTPTCPLVGCRTCMEIGSWFQRVDEQLDLELGDGA